MKMFKIFFSRLKSENEKVLHCKQLALYKTVLTFSGQKDSLEKSESSEVIVEKPSVSRSSSEKISGKFVKLKFVLKT